MQAIIMVFVVPPILSCKRRVSLESRYGMWMVFVCTNDEITLFRADRDKLILADSISCCPLAPVLIWRSLPAKISARVFVSPNRRRSLPKSTKFNFPWRSNFFELRCRHWMAKENIVCDRDESRFICVDPIVRARSPWRLYLRHISIDTTAFHVKLVM